jgi:hypothetical protein
MILCSLCQTRRAGLTYLFDNRPQGVVGYPCPISGECPDPDGLRIVAIHRRRFKAYVRSNRSDHVIPIGYSKIFERPTVPRQKQQQVCTVIDPPAPSVHASLLRKPTARTAMVLMVLRFNFTATRCKGLIYELCRGVFLESLSKAPQCPTVRSTRTGSRASAAGRSGRTAALYNGSDRTNFVESRKCELPKRSLMAC